MRPHDHRQRQLRRERRARQALHRERGREHAELRNLRDVPVTPVLDLAFECLAGQHEAMRVDRLVLEAEGQAIDGVGERGLVGSQLEVHQRGSRGSLRKSVAMMLSWISAAPEAMPATMPRW